MTQIIGVRFKAGGKVYYFDPGELTFALGEWCVVETSRGIECGEVTIANKCINDEEVVLPLKPVIRIADNADLKKVETNKEKQKKAFEICEEKIAKHGLEMSLIEVEYTFDGSKILFYFTADNRIDFRELVKDLASVFRTRIELRQIGVRDECKMMGGVGVCGRAFCCNTFMHNFYPVSIKMAKEQGLSLNPVKISGTCGRLMCCLNYEQNVYEHYGKKTPKNGAIVMTNEGKGVVCDANVLSQTVKVRIEGEDGAPIFKTYLVKDIKVIKRASEFIDKRELEQLKELEKD